MRRDIQLPSRPQADQANSARSQPQTLRAAALALAGLSAVFLFEMLDNSVLNVALPTIGHELGASTTALQWITSSYAVVFGGLMIALSAVADRFGRRKVMIIGLALLALASLATLFVGTVGELIAVRAIMGVAAAMTTPGSLALAFRLFDDELLRVRAMTVISTVGLVGLALGPTAGGLVLAFAPWQTLLLVNVPIAVIAIVCIRLGVPSDRPEELHPHPIDIVGTLSGTLTIVLALVAPTLFVDAGTASWTPWVAVAAFVLFAIIFVIRQRTSAHPLLDFALIARPLVSSGLAFKAAAGLAVAGLGYLVTLPLQLDWGWTPAKAALGMLPQVVVLIAGGAVISPLIKRIGLEKAAWLSAVVVVVGLGVYAAFGHFGYGWIAAALVLVAAGLRIVGVVAGNNVMSGLPADRTTIGAALIDTASELTTAIGIAIAGTIIAGLFTGSIASNDWTGAQTEQFRAASTFAAISLTILAGALVAAGIFFSRRGRKSTLDEGGPARR
jgi:MFS family permease